MNGNSHRPERVASVIKRAVAVIIENELSDPRIHGVSVVDAVVTKDLKTAKIYVYIEHDDTDALKALQNSAGYVRRLLAEQIKEMRVVPSLVFELDKSQSYYERIDTLIRGLSSEKHNDDNN